MTATEYLTHEALTTTRDGARAGLQFQVLLFQVLQVSTASTARSHTHEVGLHSRYITFDPPKRRSERDPYVHIWPRLREHLAHIPYQDLESLKSIFLESLTSGDGVPLRQPALGSLLTLALHFFGRRKS